MTREVLALSWRIEEQEEDSVVGTWRMRANDVWTGIKSCWSCWPQLRFWLMIQCHVKTLEAFKYHGGKTEDSASKSLV